MTWSRSGGGKIRTWVPADPYGRASVPDLKAVPVGSCLRFELPGGLRLVATRTTARRWQLHGGGIDADRLVGLPAVEMLRRDR